MKINIFLTLLFLISCTSHQVVKVGTVDIDKNTESNIKINKNENNVEYGPMAGTPSIISSKSKIQTKLIGLHLGAGSYSTLHYIGLFKNLKKNDVKIGVVSGVGLGALFAALYAKYENPDVIEWKTFKLVSELKLTRFLDGNWKKKYHDFLNKEFNNEEIQKLKIATFIPVYDSKNKKIHLLKSGSIKRALMSAITFHSKKYLSPMVIGKNQFNIEHKNFGADIILNPYLLSGTSKITQVDGLNWGIYARNFKEVNSQDTDWTLKLGNEYIDKLDNISNLVYHGEEQSKVFVENLKLFIVDERKN